MPIPAPFACRTQHVMRQDVQFLWPRQHLPRHQGRDRMADAKGEKTTRCTLCAAEFTEQELENVKACPSCGTEGIPCDIADDVTIKINWHELRILGIWASFWAGTPDFKASSRAALKAILKRVEAQYPDKTRL